MIHGKRENFNNANLHSLLYNQLHLLAFGQTLQQGDPHIRLMGLPQDFFCRNRHCIHTDSRNLPHKADAVIRYHLQLISRTHTQHIHNMVGVPAGNLHFLFIRLRNEKTMHTNLA